MIFLPHPPRRVVLKKRNFFKSLVEPRLLNIIFRANKKKTKSKRWPLYLKNWASYGNFHRPRYNKISLSQNFRISISRWIFEIMGWFLACDQFFIDFKITFTNMGSHGAPLLISRGWSNPPPPAFRWESETSPLTGLRFGWVFDNFFLLIVVRWVLISCTNNCSVLITNLACLLHWSK